MTCLRKKIPIQILLFTVITLTFTNCISDELNLKNGVNTDISFGGDSLSFPLGNTKPILLSSIIKSDNSDILKTASDGSYSLLVKDSTQMKLNGINNVTLSVKPDILPPVRLDYLNTDTPYSGVKQENKIDFSSQFLRISPSNDIKSQQNKKLIIKAGTPNSLCFNIPNQNINININKFVSADVRRINILKLKTPSHMIFKIIIDKISPEIKTLQFQNYKVQLPDFLKFDDPDVNQDNQLILNNVFNVTDGYTKTLAFDVIDFTSKGGIALNNGTFIMDRVVTMNGAIIINNTNLTPSEVGDFKIQPSIVFDDMQVKLIDGEIKPVIEQIKQTIALKLPDIFKQKDNILDIQNPIITIQVDNTMGFTIDTDLSLVSSNNGTPIQNGTVSTQFTVPSATTLGQSSWNNYWISKSGNNVPSGYQSIVVPDLPNLMRVAPDQITINVSPRISGDRQFVDLYAQKNQMNLKYSVHVPFDFGENFHILYLDTIKNLNKNMDQSDKLTNQLELVADIDNKIPLNLDFVVVPLDNLMQEIKDVVSITGIIKACNSDGSSVKSSINLVLKETVAGSIKKIDALQLKATATKNSAVAGMLLNANQSMTVKVRIKLPKGITITHN